MVTQRKPKASKYLTTPTRPVQVDRDRSVAGLLEKMEGTGFGGRQLAEAHRIWLDMLGDNTTIMVAGSGALIPAGMRRLLAYVIKNRFVDVLVLSGPLLFHDLHETLGRYHFQAHPTMTDAELESAQISRMWDLLASDEEYREAKEWIGGFTNQLDQSRPYSPREFLHLLGRELAETSCACPSAVTIRTLRRLSQASPNAREAKPCPPPSASPAIPTVGHEPAGIVRCPAAHSRA